MDFKKFEEQINNQAEGKPSFKPVYSVICWREVNCQKHHILYYSILTARSGRNQLMKTRRYSLGPTSMAKRASIGVWIINCREGSSMLTRATKEMQDTAVGTVSHKTT